MEEREQRTPAQDVWAWQEAGSLANFCSWQFLLLKLVNIHNITISFIVQEQSF